MIHNKEGPIGPIAADGCASSIILTRCAGSEPSKEHNDGY